MEGDKTMASTMQTWNTTDFLSWLLAPRAEPRPREHGRVETTTDARGVKRWYLNGQLHRDGGPAVEHPDGGSYWYCHGRKHRDDGPAVLYASGQKEWHVNGELRCLETTDGSRYWYRNGRRHREDGPAVDEPRGRRAWYHHGCPVTAGN